MLSAHTIHKVWRLYRVPTFLLVHRSHNFACSKNHHIFVQELGNKNSIRKVVSRIRTAQFPDVPANLVDLAVIPPWSKTIQDIPQPFLIGDNNDRNNRVIVFSSPACLQKLSQAQEFFVDGNFNLAPPQFEQIYVIRVPARGGALTCVYALLMTKNEEAYNAMYNFINQACINQGYNVPNPRLVHCDFEVAAHNAARTAYPGTDIKGCFYHLCQVRVMPLLPSTGTTHNLIKTCVKFCLNLTGHVRAAIRFFWAQKMLNHNKLFEQTRKKWVKIDF